MKVQYSSFCWKQIYSISQIISSTDFTEQRSDLLKFRSFHFILRHFCSMKASTSLIPNILFKENIHCFNKFQFNLTKSQKIHLHKRRTQNWRQKNKLKQLTSSILSAGFILTTQQRTSQFFLSWFVVKDSTSAKQYLVALVALSPSIFQLINFASPMRLADHH